MARTRSHHTSTVIFEDGLIDRLKARYGDVVTVDAFVSEVRDMARRKVVGNPSGLLVSWVRNAASKARDGAMSPAAQSDELDRYAEFYVDLYRIIGEQQLGPGQIAQLLERARRGSLPKINPRIIDRLEQLGARWPDSHEPVPTAATAGS